MSPPVETVSNDAALPKTADVVVIGGGIIGVAAAYALAKKGHSVALLEKGVIAGEQSSRNWGWCRQQNRDPREMPLIKLSLDIWDGLAREIGADLGFRRTGLIYVTTRQEDIDRWERWREIAVGYQIQSHMLTAGQAREFTPGSVGDWIGGVHSPTDGRAEPSKAAPTLAVAAQALGVSIHQGCAARGLETTGGSVSAVITEKGVIRTTSVLCAGGAWTSMFCRRHGIPLPQASVRSTSFCTDSAPEVVPGGLATPEFTIRRRLDNGYTVGLSGRGTLEITPQGLRYARQFWRTFKRRRAGLRFSLGRSFLQGPQSLQSWAFDGISPFETTRVLDPAPDPVLVETGLAKLRATYPALAGIRMARSWGGLVDSMPDAIPVISPVERLKGFYLATGFSGHGFGIGPAAGRLAADLVAGDTPVVDPYPYRYRRLVDGTDLGAPGML